MEINRYEINRYIDYIQDQNDSTFEYLNKAKMMGVRCVFTNMFEAKQVIEYMKETNIIVAAAVDFPLGKCCIEANLKDIENFYNLGVKEIDYVLNQYAIEHRNYDYIEKQMLAISQFCREREIVDKCIVEMCKLDEESKIRVCEIAKKVRPKFLKTSTGRSTSGAKLEDVMLMKKILQNDVEIKAAGGIKTFEFAKELVDAGASALGASAAMKIIEEGNA